MFLNPSVKDLSTIKMLLIYIDLGLLYKPCISLVHKPHSKSPSNLRDLDALD